jgi:hypothetical protein
MSCVFNDTIWNCAAVWLAIAEQGFKSVIHVGLDVAVEQAEAGLVGGEFDGGTAIEQDDYRVLDEAGRGFSVEVYEFELVAVQMQRVGVVGAVAEG